MHSSQLRLQTSFEPFSAETTRTYFPSAQQPQKKQKMSLSTTYFIAASARSKLGREASRPDHNLRLLVGHANLLDSLMVELHDAEREQEAWFNQTMKRNEQPRHIQWADTIVEETELDEDDDSASDTSESDDEYDEDDFELAIPHKLRSTPVMISSQQEDGDEEIYDDEYDEEHALVRTASHSPPELVDDSDSDDESPPTSPPQPTLNFTVEQAIAPTGFFDEKQASLDAHEQAAFIEDGFFIPQRNTPQLVAAF